jgi:DNA-binding MarR family transcriptional regulator
MEDLNIAVVLNPLEIEASAEKRRPIMVANMQVSLNQCKLFLRAIAPSGNLFLLITLQELRRQGMTFTAFYALQRTISEGEISESRLRQETGLEDYEISRACKFLATSGLIEIHRSEGDRRARVLSPTKRGVQVHTQVISAAAKRLQKRISMLEGFSAVAEDRRLIEATEAFRKSNQILLGPLQLSFFDTSPDAMDS